MEIHQETHNNLGPISKSRWPKAAITGATGGLGSAFARQLAAKGYHLLLTDISVERLELLATRIREECQVEVEYIAADLCSVNDVKTLAEAFSRAINLEVLVNCAGFGGTSSRFAVSNMDRLLAMMQVHITASVALTRAVVPGMIERDCGYIINVASIMGYVRKGPIKYCASKRFLIDFSERLQFELSGTGICVQALCPGVMQTAFFRDPHFVNTNASQFIPKFAWLDVDYVVATSLKALRGKRVVCIPGQLYRWICLLSDSSVRRWLIGDGRRRRISQPRRSPYGLIDRDLSKEANTGCEDSSAMKHVVVTGVSTGIGRSTVQLLVRRGFHVFGTVRVLEHAQELKAELGDQFTPLVCDVCDESSIQEAANTVEKALSGQLLWGLVNNAGVALVGPLMHLPLKQVRNQMEVNIVGLIGVTQAFLPLLGARRNLSDNLESGRIVNVSSISGIIPLPMFGAYAASKFAVEALSRSLRTELNWYKIPVIIIEPGPIESPIWNKMIDVERYKDTDYADACKSTKFMLNRTNDQGALPVLKASKAILRALTDRRPKNRYIVNQYPGLRKFAANLLPHSWLDRILVRHFRKSGGG